MNTRNTGHPLVYLFLALMFAAPACRSTGPVTGPATGSSGAFEGIPAFAWQDDDDDDEEAVVEEVVEVDDDDGKGVLWHILLYVPNRVFDVFDIVRLRLRLGPGIQLGARATDLLDVNLGTYASIWIGLHGPRGKPSIPWPVGVETFTGAEVSLASASVEGGVNYGATEFGFGTQLLLLGFDLGVDPVEIVDLLAGFIFIDIRGDDF